MAANTSTIWDFFEQRSASEYVWRGVGQRTLFTPGGQIRSGASELRFPGADRNSIPSGEKSQQSGIVHYYTVGRHLLNSGSSGTLYKKIRYARLYPGIDAIFWADHGILEYNFEVAPRARPDLIRIEHPGSRLSVNRDGDLVAGAPARTVHKRPFAFQVRDGRRVRVACQFELLPDGSAGFHLGPYDEGAPLTIDPVLNFSTDIGGAGNEAVYAMVTDAAGSVYIAGETDSIAFTGAGRRGSSDAFVAKLQSSGAGFEYLVYLAGSGRDVARGIAADSSGNIYVGGSTGSADFPVTRGPANAGLNDAFVAKLGPAGTLIYASTVGGAGSDDGYGVAIDAAGNAYITGQTTSVALPVTSGAFQRLYGGGMSDCFVAKLNPAGSTLLYATYLGGSNLDLCRGIAVDSIGNAYVTGTTYSSNYPVQAALKSALSGGSDAFVTKLAAGGSVLAYSTFLGGASIDEGNAITIDGSGAAYVTGHTQSPDFPVLFGAPQITRAGDYEAFVSKLAPDGASLNYSTFYGGAGVDSATAIALDSKNRAVIGGFTTSANLPLKDPVQAAWRGSFEGFVAVLDGSQWLFATYLGGSTEDRVYAVAVAPSNRIYAAGGTQSSDFPGVRNRMQAAGNPDLFVSQMTYEEPVAAMTDFNPLPPCRLADTRPEQNKPAPFGAPYLSAGGVRTFPFASHPTCKVPAGAVAYSLNVTVLPRRSGVNWLTLWAAGQPQPATPTPFEGPVVANAEIVSAGASGAISVHATQDADLIIDINGYFGPSAAPLAFYVLKPCRIADTRVEQNKKGEFGPPRLEPWVQRTFTIPASPCAVPSTARAYSLNMTTVPAGPLDWLSTWPGGQSYPYVSTLNSPSGYFMANAAIVPAGVNGAIIAMAGNPTDFIIDTNGYFAASGSPGALHFHPVTPCRAVDTRMGQGRTGEFGPPRLEGESDRSFTITAAACGIPPEARAYSVNVSAFPYGPLSWLSVWPTGQPYPFVSTLNSPGGRAMANAAIIPSGANGAITVRTGEPADVVVDVNGYFAP